MSNDKKLDPQERRDRIIELRTLEDGWLDGYGIASIPEISDFMTEFLEDLILSGKQLPAIFPHERGGMNFEWHVPSGHICFSVEDTSDIYILGNFKEPIEDFRYFEYENPRVAYEHVKQWVPVVKQ